MPLLAPITLALILLLVGAFGGVQPQWYLPVDAVLLLFGLFAALTPTPSTENRKPKTENSLAFAGALLLLGIPILQLALHATADRAATATAFLQLAAAVAVFFVARRFASLDRYAPVFALLAGLLGLEAILQLFLSPTQVFGFFTVHTTVPMGSFVNRDDFAACMELLLPFALVLAVRTDDRKPKTKNGRVAALWWALWWALAASLCLGAVVLSASRGGAIATGLELLAFFAWRYTRTANTSVLLGAGLLVLLALGTYTAGWGTLLSHFGESGVTDTGRVAFLQSSLAMAREKPALGQGAGAWDAVYPRLARFDDGHDPGYAHSDYAQLAAEEGLTGLAAAAVLLFAFVLATPAARRRYETFAFAAIAGLAAFALHAGMDFLFHIPALLLLFAFITGATMSRTSQPTNT